MTENQFPDPFNEANSAAARALLRDAAAALAVARAIAQAEARRQQRKMIKNERERAALEAREKAEREATRARWAPAADRQWLRSANLVEVSAVWCAAVHYADPASDLYDRSAERAVDNCEVRLRELHPYAMNRYDRLRADGVSRIDAIVEVAPLFLNHPTARPHEENPRLGIAARGLGDPWIDEVYGPSREGFEQHVAEQQIDRGSRIVGRMQARALADDRPLLGPDEQRTALEATTNLSPEIIGKVVPDPSPSAPRPVRRPWENDFPFPIEEVVYLAAQHPEAPASPRPRPVPAHRPRRVPHA